MSGTRMNLSIGLALSSYWKGTRQNGDLVRGGQIQAVVDPLKA
jgi:hypothetical protein